ncbi:uncharacterized protein LOC143020890 [Oratosquilla oratoria]|uniref:uncharacterized protein LOC143020890 n=1 Tax=Oratosquilla oratoria TaxID=337810 RepID=UPI003F770E28
MVQTRKRRLSEGEGQVDNVPVAKTPRKISSTQHVSSPRPSRTGTTPRRTTRSSEKDEVDKTDSAVDKNPSTPRRSSRRLSQSLETISEDSPLPNVQNDTPSRTKRKSRSSDLGSKPETVETLNFDDSTDKTQDDHVSEVTPQDQKSSESGSTESMGDDVKDNVTNVEKDRREEKRKSIITLDTVVEEEEYEAEAGAEKDKPEVQAQTGVDTDCTDANSAKRAVCKSSLKGKNKKLINSEEVSSPSAMESEESKHSSRNESEVEGTGNQNECLSLRENVENIEKQVEDITSKTDKGVKRDLSSCDAVVENVDNKSCSTEVMADKLDVVELAESEDSSSKSEIVDSIGNQSESLNLKENVEQGENKVEDIESKADDNVKPDIIADESNASKALEETAEVTQEEVNTEQSVGLNQEEGGDTSQSGELEEEASELEVMETDEFTGEEKENISLGTAKSEKVVSEGEDSELMEKSEKQNDGSNQEIEKKENAKTLEVPNPVIGQVPRGQPKSGRWWKNEKKRFSSVVKVKPLKTSWAKKMQVKEERQNILAATAAVKEEKRQKLEQLRERQRINKEKREENARKAEVVQLIKDPRKIKKMKRKQLRQIEKRDPGSIRK